MFENLKKVNFYNITVIFVTVFVLLALLLDAILNLPSEISKLIRYADWTICVFFFYDFVMTFKQADNKIKYLYTWGWIDLLASIPAVNWFRYGKLIRIFRLLKFFKLAKSKKNYVLNINKRDLSSTIVIVATLLMMVIFSASIAILFFETAPNSNIKTAEDAVWWAIVTITTVGYGDFYPVTMGGRIVAILLLLIGVSMFFTLTALLVPFFSRHDKDDED